jgi:hypothetical protein
MMQLSKGGNHDGGVDKDLMIMMQVSNDGIF